MLVCVCFFPSLIFYPLFLSFFELATFLLFEVIDELHYRWVISKGDHLPWRPLKRTKVFLMTECSVYRKIQLNQRICDPSNLKHIQVALFQSYAALNEAQVKK